MNLEEIDYLVVKMVKDSMDENTIKQELLSSVERVFPLPEITASASTVPSNQVTQLSATVTNAKYGPIWYVFPEFSGEIKDANGNIVTQGTEVYFHPSAEFEEQSQIIVSAQGEGCYEVSAFIAIEEAVEPQEEVPEEEFTFPMDDITNSFKYDPNFSFNNLHAGWRDYYANALNNAETSLAAGTMRYDTEPCRYNDVSGNAFGRVNSLILKALLELYLRTGNQRCIHIAANSLEAAMQGMQSNVGAYSDNSEVFKCLYDDGSGFKAQTGKSDFYKMLERQSYFDTPVTVDHDDGTTFEISWTTMPKMIYSRYYNRDIDWTYNGSDLHLHDAIPRKAPIVAWAMIFDANRDLARINGGTSLGEIADWFYEWNYKDLSFWRYRSANSTPDVPKVGVMRGGQVDWGIYIYHDLMQQLEFDWFNYLWAKYRRQRDGDILDGRRAQFWWRSYNARKTAIHESNAFVDAPNGYGVMMGCHVMSWYQQNWIGKSEIDSYKGQGWWIRYDNDGMPPAKIISLTGDSDLEDWAERLANNYSQLYVGRLDSQGRPNRIISRGMNGWQNKFTDGTDVPKDPRFPVPFSSATPKYEYSGTNPDGKSVSSMNSLFVNGCGYFCVDRDPTPDKQNVKAWLKMLNQWGSIKLDGLRGYRLPTGNSSFEIVYRQAVIAQIGMKYDMDPTRISIR